MPGPSSDEEVTALLNTWNNGDQTALEKLLPLVERELRALAHAYLLRNRPGHDIETTALMNEALLRLIDDRSQINWQSRRHFFAIAAYIMRKVLIDHARNRLGAEPVEIPLSAATNLAKEKNERILLLDEALNKLAKLDAQKSRIVELKYFGGLTMRETAQVLGIPMGIVERDWRFARAWLQREITGEGAETFSVPIITQKPQKIIQKREMPASVTAGTERKLAEAWANRELVETLMIGKWAGLKALVQLRRSHNVTKEELASVLETDAVIVSFILLKLEEFGALKKQDSFLSLTNRGAELLKNFEMAIGKASTD
jgi:RNA polymerase sigma-70 factor, ECF subfamily